VALGMKVGTQVNTKSPSEGQREHVGNATQQSLIPFFRNYHHPPTGFSSRLTRQKKKGKKTHQKTSIWTFLITFGLLWDEVDGLGFASNEFSSPVNPDIGRLADVIGHWEAQVAIQHGLVGVNIGHHLDFSGNL